MQQTDSVLNIASRIASGAVSAREVVETTLARISSLDKHLNCFTAVTAERALAEADAIDSRRLRGEPLGSLAGVPFAVKNLFDVQGLPTLAGSRINADLAPAQHDAFVVRKLKAAGAVLVGALNMEEYAYGFTTENAHYGPSRNPHDTRRIAGGSSGGSAAAVAGGMVPLSLGTDTNGSIRVPASLCGIFGLKPTFGRLSRQGTFPLATSLDHVGPFCRSVADLAAAYDAMQGHDPDDPVCVPRKAELVGQTLNESTGTTLRIAIAGAYYRNSLTSEAQDALDTVARALGAKREVEIPEAARARSAALLITGSEAANIHLANLKSRPQDFDPATRERLLAAALQPANWLLHAQRFRRWYRDQVLALFRETDLIIAAATPLVAQPIGQDTVQINGEILPLRPTYGMLSAPISFIGLPVLTVPVKRATEGLPLGVQIIAAPWREADAFRVAAQLEREGIAVTPPVSEVHGHE